MKKLLLSLLFFNLLQAEYIVYENDQEKVYLLKSTDSDFLTEQFITNFFDELIENLEDLWDNDEDDEDGNDEDEDDELLKALLEAKKTVTLLLKELIEKIKNKDIELKNTILSFTEEQKKIFITECIKSVQLFYVDAYIVNKAINNTELIGEACFHAENKDESIYELDTIMINENYQRKGIGKAMITTAEETLHPKEIVLDAVESAFGFYEKLGFKHIPETMDDGILDVNMKKTYC